MSDEITAEQMAVVRWWADAPDDATVGEARAKFDDVGLTPRLAQLAMYELWAQAGEGQT